jgi:hypothetical protein
MITILLKYIIVQGKKFSLLLQQKPFIICGFQWSGVKDEIIELLYRRESQGKTKIYTICLVVLPTMFDSALVDGFRSVRN